MKPLPNLTEVLQGKRLLIFDFDGTVADTTPLHASAFAQILAPLGVAVDYSDIAGLKTLDALRKCLKSAKRLLDDAALDALVVAKQRRARQMIAESLQPLNGVDAFLRWASARYRLAMVTSGSRVTVSLALYKLGYTGWFDPFLCGDDVAFGKPDPEGFLRALEISGLSKEDGLVFEDSDAGLEAARSAALDAIDVRITSWQKINEALLLDQTYLDTR